MLLKFECPQCGQLLKTEQEECPRCTLFESGGTQFRLKVVKKVEDIMKSDKSTGTKEDDAPASDEDK